MTAWLWRIIRWIGGPDRAEWVDAMEAESVAAAHRSTIWTIGCVGAMLIDRIRRETKSIVWILLLPLVVILLRYALFFPMVAISRAYDLPRWASLSAGIFEALPVAILLGWLTARRGALFPAIAAFLTYHAISMLHWWHFFGQGPSVFFDGSMEIYHLHAQLGMAIDLGVWLLGGLIGARWHRLRRD